MDSFDKQILAVLKNGESLEFGQILSQVRFSHNTLRLHLTRLTHQGMVLQADKPRKGPGRPTLAYLLAPNMKRQVTLTLEDPYVSIVSMTFQKLKHVCRFEKGGFCKETYRSCAAQICPQILKER
jgi:predicted ArsR family transcriptional regulator